MAQTPQRPRNSLDEILHAVAALSDDDRRMLLGELIVALGQPKIAGTLRVRSTTPKWTEVELDILRMVLILALDRLQHKTPAEFAAPLMEEIRGRLAS